MWYVTYVKVLAILSIIAAVVLTVLFNYRAVYFMIFVWFAGVIIPLPFTKYYDIIVSKFKAGVNKLAPEMDELSFVNIGFISLFVVIPGFIWFFNEAVLMFSGKIDASTFRTVYGLIIAVACFIGLLYCYALSFYYAFTKRIPEGRKLNALYIVSGIHLFFYGFASSIYSMAVSYYSKVTFTFFDIMIVVFGFFCVIRSVLFFASLQDVKVEEYFWPINAHKDELMITLAASGVIMLLSYYFNYNSLLMPALAIEVSDGFVRKIYSFFKKFFVTPLDY